MQNDFRNKNLQGYSFRNQNLVSADFSGADVRGADFTNAVLVHANLSCVRAGLENQWIILLAIFSIFLLVLSGFITTYSASLIDYSVLYNPLLGAFTLLAMSILLTVIIFRGFNIELGVLIVILLDFEIGVFGATDNGDLAVSSVFGALGITGLTCSIGTVSLALVLLVKVFPLKIANVIGRLIALIGAERGLHYAYPKIYQVFPHTPAVKVVLIGLIAIVIVLILSPYIARKALEGKKRYSLIKTVAVSISVIRGTCFQGADLTDADLSHTTLENTDLTQATITRTCWFQVKNIQQARMVGTYLEQLEIQNLVVSKNGQGQDFSYRSLKGLNLQDAKLTDANFTGADLSEASLQGADLSRSKLIQAQLYRTNLSNSCFTGAYIQNWSISTDTQFNNVQCDYVYMKQPTIDDPDPCRKPDNRSENFGEGDFSDFISPIITTLSLYYQQNVDPRAVAATYKTVDLFHHKQVEPSAAVLALQKLANQHPDAGIEVFALEGGRSEKIRLQTKVNFSANPSELSEEYFENYNQFKSTPHLELQALVKGFVEKDAQIRSLLEILQVAQSQPKSYIEIHNVHNNEGELTMSQNRGNINIKGVQGNVSGIVAAGENQEITGVAIGAISGAVTNTIDQLPNSSGLEEPSIRDLLTQLKIAIEGETVMTDEDKVEALEQVKTLAEAGRKPNDSALQKAAKTAMKILKGTVASLPDAAKLAEACSKLLPAITALLALV